VRRPKRGSVGDLVKRLQFTPTMTNWVG
jgi:hypothetical protein